jgi:protocatechuate 3,4-dioxygenase beta subunit
MQDCPTDQAHEEREEAPNEFIISRRAALAGVMGMILTPVSGLLSPAMASSTLKQAAEIGDVLNDLPDVCRVAAASVEGPYYIDKAIVRSDIREQQLGVPLELELRVVNSNAGCRPIEGVVVSVWHCNAEGEYSGYLFNDPNKLPDLTAADKFGHIKQEGAERFLRGAQTTDADGKVTFHTIVPGWYTPRAVHIHARIFLSESTMLTTQLYFPQSLINTIQSTEVAYKARGLSIYTNENDLVRRQSGIVGATDILKVTARDDGSLRATMTIGAGNE